MSDYGELVGLGIYAPRPWDTVFRWLEAASRYAGHFNAHALKGFEIAELQADEIRTFTGSRKRVRWVFTALEVSSRLWVGLAVGSRTYGNVKRCLLDVLLRGRVYSRFLFTTDGFDMYRWLVDRYLMGACIYGQVIKKRKKNRVTTVSRSLLCGTREQLDDALLNSEDSSTLNTSFVERHNLTIRQGSSYLCRRSACHAKETRPLEEHLELLRLHYNFIRPHSALKFGKEVRTPAMQAGLAARKLCFRDVFTRRLFFFLCILAAFFTWLESLGKLLEEMWSSMSLGFCFNNT